MLTLDELRDHFRRHDPFSGYFGVEIVEIGEGRAVAEMPLDGRHLNDRGEAHDGALFTLADMAFAAASNASGLYCANAQTSISFLRPVRKGPLRGEARRLQAGRLSSYEIRLTDAEGELVAEATITGYGLGAPLP